MARLVIEQDWTGYAPADCRWTCTDEDWEPGRICGSGATPEQAVTEYLSKLSDEDLEHHTWAAEALGESSAHLALMKAEQEDRKGGG